MNKRIFGIAVLAASLMAPTAFAATQDNTTAKQEQCQKKDCKDKKECKGKQECNGDKKECNGGKKAHHKGFKGGQKRGGFDPFAGIELTPDQQTKVNALMESQKQRHEAMRAQRKEQKQLDKEAAREARQADMQQFDAQVQTILTADQFEVYTANRKAMQEMKAKAKVQHDKNMKDAKLQCKGDSCFKKGRPVNPKAIYPKKEKK